MSDYDGSVFDIVKKWCSDNEDFLIKRNLQLEIKGPNVEGNINTLKLDSDNDNFISTVIFWETGACDLEVIEISSEERFCKTVQVKDQFDIDRLLTSFYSDFGKLKGREGLYY
jgi:hypothetical protein